jgi:hypothetical protein
MIRGALESKGIAGDAGLAQKRSYDDERVICTRLAIALQNNANKKQITKQREKKIVCRLNSFHYVGNTKPFSPSRIFL